MKRLLIISPHFPPINAPDMQRVRMSLPYYESCGWQATVLAVDPRYVRAMSDPALLKTLPPSVPVHWAKAIPAWLAGCFALGSLGIRSWLHLLVAGNRLLAQGNFDLIFFSTTQFFTLTLGPIWQRRFGVPYVIDIQDPWRTEYYERPGSSPPPGGWKYQFARRIAEWGEPRAFRSASGFMSVSGHYFEELRECYPWFAEKPQDTIKFGATREDLKAAQHLLATRHPPAPGCLVRLTYTGAAGPVMPHAINVLFAAVRQYRSLHPERAKNLRLSFIGTSYASAKRAQNSILPIANMFGLADITEEVPMRIGHIESIAHQLQSDALLLFGSSDLAYSPSKIYGYYLAGKPILAMAFQDSCLESILQELDCATIASFTENGPKNAAMATIITFLDHAMEGFVHYSHPKRNDIFFDEQYLSEQNTRRQAALFDQALEFARSQVR